MSAGAREATSGENAPGLATGAGKGS